MPYTDAVFVMPDLKGPGGNAYWLLGEASSALKKAGYDKELREQFHAEATSSDYEHLLATIMAWFVVVTARTEYVVINDPNTQEDS